MNCECMYIMTKNNTIDGAKEFCKYLEKLANDKEEEVCPVAIGRIKADCKLTSDYDGWNTPFKVKAGTFFVWAYGKDYCMFRIKPKGARRGFPYTTWLTNHDNYDKYVVDLLEYDGSEFKEIKKK